MKILIVNGTDINKPASGSGVVMKQFLEYVPVSVEPFFFNIGGEVTPYDFEKNNVIPKKRNYFLERMIPVVTFTSVMYSRFLIDKNVLNKIKTIIYENDFDVIYYHDTIAMRYFFHLDDVSQQCHLIDLHSCSYSYYLSSTKNMIKKTMYLREKFFSFLYEKSIIKNYDAIYLVNKDEAKLARKKYKTEKYFGVPLGANLETGFLEKNSQKGFFKFVYIGNLKYKANLDGLVFFIENFFLKLEGEIKYELHVIGPGGDALNYYSSNIFSYGFVDDLKSLLSGMQLGVATMVNGSGMKNKIFDYIRHGIPVVVNSYTLKSNYIQSDYLYKVDTVEDIKGYIDNYDYNTDPNKIRESIRLYDQENSAKEFWKNIMENK